MYATGIFVIESTKLQLVVTDVIDILNVSVIDITVTAMTWLLCNKQLAK